MLACSLGKKSFTVSAKMNNYFFQSINTCSTSTKSQFWSQCTFLESNWKMWKYSIIDSCHCVVYCHEDKMNKVNIEEMLVTSQVHEILI